MTLDKYICGEEKNAAHRAVSQMMDGFDVGISYADMIRHRLCGSAADQCRDVYYVMREGEIGLSRLWMGYGKHEGAVGNWGNFYTAPDMRGRGIGGKLLEFWQEDLLSTENKPACLLCTSREYAGLYSRFGFRPAISGSDGGPLYLPLGDSPASFTEFARGYYKPSPLIFHRPATIEYRHEIDCLLRFSFIEAGMPFGIGDIAYLEAGLLYYPERVGMLFTECGRCVGWSFDGNIQLHPAYKKSEIINETFANRAELFERKTL